jgi:hypothetical protein
MTERIAVVARLSGGLLPAEGAGDESIQWVSLPCLATAYFDGRDVTERRVLVDGAAGYPTAACPGCGLVRDTRYPLCCELASLHAFR